jgi:hypothetical protein
MRGKPRPGPTDTVVTTSAAPSVRVGFLVAGSAPGRLLVDYDGNAGGPVEARATVSLDAAAVEEAVATRRGAVLLFEDVAHPILVGLLAPEPGAALLGSLLRAPAAAPPPSRPTEARVDGKRVVLEGEQEVVLRCGEASITLRRDGKVVLRGAYVETTAKGLNRIRGGSVKIN